MTFVRPREAFYLHSIRTRIFLLITHYVLYILCNWNYFVSLQLDNEPFLLLLLDLCFAKF